MYSWTSSRVWSVLLKAVAGSTAHHHEAREVLFAEVSRFEDDVFALIKAMDFLPSPAAACMNY